MAFTHVAAGTGAVVASGGLTPTEPAGAQQGDLIVAYIAYRGAANFTLPAGWTLVAQETSGNTYASAGPAICSALLAYIVRGASAPSYTFTRSGGDVAMASVRAYRSSNGGAAIALDTFSQNTLSSHSPTATTAGFSTAIADELLIAVGATYPSFTGGNWTGFAAATSPTTASGALDSTSGTLTDAWTERTDAATATGGDVSLGVFDTIKSTAGATGQFSVTTDNNTRSTLIVGAFRDTVPIPPVSSSGDVTIGKQSVSGAGTRTVPVRTASGSIAIDKQSASGSAVQTFPARSAAGAIAIPKQGASGAAIASPPVFAGAGGAIIDKQSAAGAGVRTVPVYAGAGAVGITKQSASGAGLRTLPVAATGAVLIGKQTAAGTGVRTVPVFTAAGAVMIDAQSASGAGAHTPPVFAAAGGLVIAKQSASGSGVRTVPIFSATGAVSIRKQAVGGSGTVPTSDATGSATIPKQSTLGVGTVAPPVFAGVGAVPIAKQAASGAGSRTIPVRIGAGAVVIDKQAASGVAVAASPIFVAAGAVSIAKQSAAGAGAHAALHTGVGAVSIDKPVVSGSGATAPPVFAAVGAVAISKASAAGAGQTVVPVYAGSGSAVIPKQSVAGTGGAAIPFFTGSGAVDVPKQSAAGVGATAPPVFLAIGAVVIPKAAAEGAAGTEVPVYSGAAGAIISKQTASGAGVRTVPVFVAAGALSIPKAVAAGIGSITLPDAIVASGEVQIPRQVATGSGAVENPTLGVGAVIIPKQTVEWAFSFEPPVYVGAGDVAIPKAGAAGAGVFVADPGILAYGAIEITKAAAVGAGGFTEPIAVAGLRFGFAWVTGEESMFHIGLVREDEDVSQFELVHSEGAFALLSIVIRNPRRSFLQPGAPLWMWFSENGVPLFFGRLVAIPEDLHKELVTLNFIARPPDYDERKRALAGALKVAPFWDPVWIAADRLDDSDVALEARHEAWHVDRVSHQLTASDLTQGEDGVIEFAAGEILYDPSRVSYAASPLRRVRVDAELSWDQTGVGAVDITGALLDAFAVAGSTGRRLSSYTGQGLEADWPKPEASIGGGWSVGESTLTRTDGVSTPQRHRDVRILAPQPEGTAPGAFSTAFMQPSITARFYLWEFLAKLTLAYDVRRRRTERVSFVVEADVQPIVTEPGEDEAHLITVSSRAVADPIDPGEALPIGDLRRVAYLSTDRGRQSLEYLIMLARTKLLSRARAVQIEFATAFENGVQLSCRKSVAINDPRLPGGRAVGKVVEYRLNAAGNGQRIANVKIACTVGEGNAIEANPGAPEYVDADYVSGYQVYVGQTFAPVPDAITYSNISTTPADDDGVDFFNLTPAAILKRMEVINGVSVQSGALGRTFPDIPAAVEALNAVHTEVVFELEPLVGGPFLTEYAPVVSPAMIPKTISL